MGDQVDRLAQVCADYCVLDPHQLDVDLQSCARSLLSNAHPRWPDPGRVERELEDILRDVRSLRRKIDALDGRARFSLGWQSDDQSRDAAKRLKEAATPEEFAAAISAADAAMSRSPEERWIDRGTRKKLDELEAGLVAVVEKVVASSPPTKGRPRNRAAYNVALCAARVYKNITGETPGFWNGGSTPFSRMLEAIYRELGIKVDLKKPIEWARYKLDEET